MYRNHIAVQNMQFLKGGTGTPMDAYIVEAVADGPVDKLGEGLGLRSSQSFLPERC